jgi:protein required for attachment to host cells
MRDLFIRNGDWVVVCDGAKALVFENAGDIPQLEDGRSIRA